MLSIVYASSAVKLFTEQEIIKLLEISQRNNEQSGITGMLLYNGGNFIQVIEGPDEAVLALYDTIKRDRRHYKVTLLGQDPIHERQFPDWTMGFQDLKKLSPEQQTRFSSFLVDDFTPEFFQDKPTRAYILLLSFKETMR